MPISKKKEIAKQKVTRMLEAGDLTIEDVIDIVIDKNTIVGMGLITLGDTLKRYCYNKFKKVDYDARNIW